MSSNSRTLEAAADRALNEAWWRIADRPVEIASAKSRPPQDSFCDYRWIVARLCLFIADRATLEVRHHDLSVVDRIMAFKDGARRRFRGGLGLHDDPRHHTSPICGYAIGLKKSQPPLRPWRRIIIAYRLAETASSFSLTTLPSTSR